MIGKKSLGFLLIACLLTVGIASVYAAGSNPFDTLWADFAAFQENVGSTLGQMWTRIDVVEDKVATIQFMETIADLEARILVLEAVISNPGTPGPEGPAGPPGPGFGELIHDSGWIAIEPGLNTICTLDNRNVFVYMIGRNSIGKIHQIAYGGDVFNIPEEKIRGAYWYITSDNELWVFRRYDDLSWSNVRVMVWQLPA